MSEPILNDEQKRRFIELFEKFGGKRDGTISFEDLGKIFREIQRPIEQKELMQLEAQYQDKKIDKQLYLELVVQRMQEPDNEIEIRKAFSTLFGDKKVVTTEELKNVLMQFGERISEDEANELINDIGVKDGQIDINQFISKVFVDK